MGAIVEKLKLGKRNVKIVAFPGTDEQIGIVPLAENDIQEALFTTEKVFKEAGIEVNAMTMGAYTSEFNLQILYRALVDPEKKKPDGTFERYFRTADELRGVIKAEAKSILVDEYNAWEAECSPSPRRMTEEELEALVEEVKRDPRVTPGLVTSLSTAHGLIAFMASQLVTSRKASGSISSQ